MGRELLEEAIEHFEEQTDRKPILSLGIREWQYKNYRNLIRQGYSAKQSSFEKQNVGQYLIHIGY